MNQEEQEREITDLEDIDRNPIRPISKKETTVVISKLKLGKAAGQDQIALERLKYIGE